MKIKSLTIYCSSSQIIEKKFFKMAMEIAEIIAKYKIKVIGCKTIRNKNKLALSSRNFLLKKDELKKVEIIIKKFHDLKKDIKKNKNINNFLRKSKKELEKILKIKIEYLENRNTKDLKKSNKFLGSKIFLSFYFKNIRLIDNF